jgi:hypothetical protein
MPGYFWFPSILSFKFGTSLIHSGIPIFNFFSADVPLICRLSDSKLCSNSRISSGYRSLHLVYSLSEKKNYMYGLTSVYQTLISRIPWICQSELEVRPTFFVYFDVKYFVASLQFLWKEMLILSWLSNTFFTYFEPSDI